jgi:hypothetical protein
MKRIDNTVKICFLTAGEERSREEKEIDALDKETISSKTH